MPAKTRPSKAKTASNLAAMNASKKRPRINPHTVVLDDDAVVAYQEAKQALDARERHLLESRPRRIAAVRADFTAATPPDEQAQALSQIHQADDLELDALRSDVDAAREALEAATCTYRFRALGANAWKALKAEHPATDADHEATREATGKDDDRAQWHFDTLAPALIKAACVSPVLSDEDVTEIFEGDDWNDQEIAAMFQAALIPQVSVTQSPLGRR